MTEQTYDGGTTSGPRLQWVEHQFVQGAVGCTPANASASDPCFVSLRYEEFRAGREWQTTWKTGAGATLKTVTHYFGTGAPANAGDVDMTSVPNRGLWRGFVYEHQTDETWSEGGGTARTRTTQFKYDNSANTNTTNGQAGTGRYGNLTAKTSSTAGRRPSGSPCTTTRSRTAGRPISPTGSGACTPGTT